MAHKIIDNLLLEELSEKIKNDLISSMFPWFYNNRVVDDEQSEQINSLYNYQFTHAFYLDYVQTSQYLYILKPIIDYLNPEAILRIKANLCFVSDIKKFK
jgi:hypothetical protein